MEIWKATISSTKNMRTILFSIYGNQENPEKNPIPYHRVVGRALWLPKARRYNAWKQYVVDAYLSSLNRVNKQFESILILF